MTTFTVVATDSIGQTGLSDPQDVGVVVPPTNADFAAQLRGQGANAGTVITDDAANTWTRNGVTTSTARFKMGTSSLLYASGNNLQKARDAKFNFGTGDFTIEAWIYPTSNTGSAQFSSFFSDRNGGAQFNSQLWMSAGTLTFTYGIAATLRIDFGGGAGGAIPLNTWSHVAISRASGVMRLYLNGVKVNQKNEANALRTDTATIYVGGSNGFVDAWFVGNMHLRVLKGKGIYTSDLFTPPLAFNP